MHTYVCSFSHSTVSWRPLSHMFLCVPQLRLCRWSPPREQSHKLWAVWQSVRKWCRQRWQLWRPNKPFISSDHLNPLSSLSVSVAFVSVRSRSRRPCCSWSSTRPKSSIGQRRQWPRGTAVTSTRWCAGPSASLVSLRLMSRFWSLQTHMAFLPLCSIRCTVESHANIFGRKLASKLSVGVMGCLPVLCHATWKCSDSIILSFDIWHLLRVITLHPHFSCLFFESTTQHVGLTELEENKQPLFTLSHAAPRSACRLIVLIVILNIYVLFCVYNNMWS